MTLRRPLRTLLSEYSPRAGGPLVEAKWDPAFTTMASEPEGYAWPDLELESEDPAGSILLVTAPGAMGKSAAARAAAATLRAPLIDLAKVPVGGDTLTGMLTRVLGWKQAAQYSSDLMEGANALVLDSLDEAQLAAGRTHFLAFMRNVAEFVTGAAPHRQIIVFGRRDTIETAYLALLDEGVTADLASVAPLNREQSSELLDLTLDSLKLDGEYYKTHRTHSVPFGKYRDATLLSMAAALGSDKTELADAWSDAGDFLGYPPVLLVVARHLAVDNPSALMAEGRKAGAYSDQARRGGLLREVVEGILDRESGKVRKSLAPTLGLDLDDPKLSLVYTREEQVLRLLGHLGEGSRLRVPLPASLDPHERATYEEQIGAFVPDHPFLRGQALENIVFEDYLHAFVVTSPLGSIQTEAVPTFTLGPFFSHFVHVLADRVGKTALVKEDLVDDLIKSFAAGSAYPDPWVYQMRVGKASLVLGEGSIHGEPMSYLFFTIDDPSGVVELTSPVSRGVLFTDGGVSLTSSSDEMVLGPELTILAEDLDISAKRLSATAAVDSESREVGSGVGLVVSGSVRHDADLKIASHSSEALFVSWKDAWHQWVPYLIEMQELVRSVDAQASWQVLFGVRRLLSVFHASVKDDPSLYGERLDRFAVGSNPIFAACLEALIDLGVIVRESALYRLRLSRLGDFGVSYAALRGPDFAETLKRLHAEVCKSEHVLPLIQAAPRGAGPT